MLSNPIGLMCHETFGLLLYIHMHAYIHIYTYIYIYTYICMYIYIHSPPRSMQHGRRKDLLKDHGKSLCVKADVGVALWEVLAQPATRSIPFSHPVSQPAR